MDIKKLIAELIAVATGEIDHTGNVLCPDPIEGFDSRDPDCPACKILTDAAAEYDEMERRLREAEARVAELEAECAEREAGKLLAYLSNDRTQFFIPSMEGKDVKHAPYMAHWMAGWTHLYAAQPVTAPVRLTNDQIGDCIADDADMQFQSNPIKYIVVFARAVEAAVLRANGFDIQAQEGK